MAGPRIEPTQSFKIQIAMACDRAGQATVSRWPAPGHYVLSKRTTSRSFDNGRPQPLTVFTREVLPISVVMLFDTSMSMENSIGLLREGARQFVNQPLAD